jgi:eukaryotic-like serine/threonine-protein kinase
MHPDNSSDDRDPLERLAEEFAARHRRGECPSLVEYAERFPQWAERIQSLFPALLLMEHNKPGVGDETDSLNDAGVAAAPLQQLGDYRIIREVGRGGMAVVYEAEQESLGRHVALKVLLRHTRLDPRQATRFQREARAAARLHHTNIVPVYGVGEHDGIHYYVMQFIAGQGLDEVLREVQRLRRYGISTAADDHRLCRGCDGSFAASATDVARDLMSGRFDQIQAALDESQVGSPAREQASGASSAPDGKERRADRPPPPPDVPMPPAGSQTSSIGANGQRESSSLSSSSRHYWRGVARIGAQVAEALQYSHAQGVLHRDVKPSNLLLDLHGTVWVADFGLAKLADQVDLTHTGDVVGTWRYMAPERFRGVSDARSDVYSLGLTLYELLVLHPAFDGSTREELIRQVGFGVPPRPRKINPDVPRDLETIVLKAIERNPSERYQSAGELAEDLRRYLEDRPVRARRCGPAERAWRWARRNPAVASLAASVALLLAALAISSTLAAVWLNTERNRALANLWDAYLAQSHAGRSSRQAGQRFNSLDVLARAAKIRIDGELRNEAIACLALVDLRPARRFASVAHEDDGFTVDAALQRYAIGDDQGTVSVRRVADGAETVRLPRDKGPTRRLEFSPDGQYLIAAYADRNHWSYVLWDISRRDAPKKVMDRGDESLLFSPDSRRVAVALSDTVVGLFDPSTGALSKRLTVGPVRGVGAFHPDGRSLVLFDKSRRTLRLLDIERGEQLWSCSFDSEIEGVAWRGDGRLLAASGNDHRIYVWDAHANRLQSVLEGHQNSVVKLQFTHSGSLLISSSWDGSTRVWDPVRGVNLVTAHAELIRVGPDDRQVALREHATHLGFWELADGRECRALHHGMVGNRTPRPDNWGPHAIDFSPDGRLLASSDTDGARLWDPDTGASVAHLPLGDVGAVQFSPDGLHLLTRLVSGPRVWPLRPVGDGANSSLRIDPARQFPNATTGLNSTHDAWDATGRFLMARDDVRSQAVVFDVVNSIELARLGPHVGLNQCPISPDGRWVASATWKGKDVKVWEVATGRLAWQTPSDSAFVKFSPDGRWLAVGKFPGRECRLWHVGSWRPGPTIEVGASFLTMAFSRDGQVLAIDDAGRMRLVDTGSGREIATLEAGGGSSANFFCLAFSPDGTQLAAGRDHIIHLWDLRRTREQLVALGLDWERPPYPHPPDRLRLGAIVSTEASAQVLKPGSIGLEPTPVDSPHAATAEP